MQINFTKTSISLILMVIDFLLSGCATTLYHPNPQLPQAMIGTSNNTFRYLTSIYGVFQDPYECTNLEYFPRHVRLLGASVPIVANNYITILAIHSCIGKGYNYVVSFKPKANHTYLVNTYDYEENGKMHFIFSILDKIEVNKNGKQSYTYKLVPFIKRNFPLNDPMSLLGNKGGCFDSRKLDELPPIYYIQRSVPKTYFTVTFSSSK